MVVAKYYIAAQSASATIGKSFIKNSANKNSTSLTPKLFPDCLLNLDFNYTYTRSVLNECVLKNHKDRLISHLSVLMVYYS